ncbi:MAG: uridine phosphorylase [Solirubrobacterales bacterium]|nr:uridine phosphorylase [Solirubrobacterales bacterium]
MSAYLRPTAPIAADVLLPADPALAMALAQRLMVKPLMANHHHGLWGYSGRTEAGRELTVQAGGVGGPSTAAVVGELAGHGARRLVRIGGCTGLDPSLTAGDSVVVESALGADGTSAALGAELTRPDRELTDGLAGGMRRVAIVSYDLGAAAAQAMREEWVAAGIAAVDLETAAVFAMAASLGLPAAAALVVAGADDEASTEALLELGDSAELALAGPTDRPGDQQLDARPISSREPTATQPIPNRAR